MVYVLHLFKYHVLHVSRPIQQIYLRKIIQSRLLLLKTLNEGMAGERLCHMIMILKNKLQF